MSRAQARISRSAIAANCAHLAQSAGTGSALCAVVKADGYGHGMLDAAHSAIDGGAGWLAVAAGTEALALRDGGINAPVLVMGSLETAEMAALVEAGCDLVAWTGEFLEAAGRVARDGTEARIHVKLDTGMGRLGATDREVAVELARTASRSPGIKLVGAMTHLATADEPEQRDFTDLQLSRFREFEQAVRAIEPAVIAHAANSAATLGRDDAGFDMVRCGVAIYGMDPFGNDPSASGLIPAMELTSHVSQVKDLPAGGSVGYGRRFIASEDTRIATVPIGYADGVRRALSGQTDVLVGGRRVPLVGNVSMDNITLDLGRRDLQTDVGDEVVLIGERSGERILIEDWARSAQTINYEIATGIGGRTERSLRA